ncbi:hypothetical protein Pla52n_49240 [Stieleria varia]|uniref:Uncharacterized protein n=1 Tax=Stieleria varia TaxID=2528005 RepID=A0A5C6AH66_9BACT|nr:hypothetical protein Pla52n_49240 [Stieleria varia]
MKSDPAPQRKRDGIAFQKHPTKCCIKSTIVVSVIRARGCAGRVLRCLLRSPRLGCTHLGYPEVGYQSEGWQSKLGHL